MSDAIVVGTDGSDTAGRAVDEAIRMAKALDAEVHIVSAYEPLRNAKIVGAPEGAAKVWAPLPDTLVNATVDQAAAKVRISGVGVKTHAVEKDPADALLQVAEDVGANMIVVGSKGMHGARRVLGSVPNKVSHQAHCNVLIVSTDRT
ncbi:MAG: universal stress protein [Actinomycetota bacterium]|nr:universal stress protein [Actinomycetota bacterium]